MSHFNRSGLMAWDGISTVGQSRYISDQFVPVRLNFCHRRTIHGMDGGGHPKLSCWLRLKENICPLVTFLLPHPLPPTALPSFLSLLHLFSCLTECAALYRAEYFLNAGLRRILRAFHFLRQPTASKHQHKGLIALWNLRLLRERERSGTFTFPGSLSL